jgi:hypothetical protein
MAGSEKSRKEAVKTINRILKAAFLSLFYTISNSNTSKIH